MASADDYREAAATLRSHAFVFREIADGTRFQDVRFLLTAPIFVALVADLDTAVVDLEISIDEWERLANVCEGRATRCDERVEIVCGMEDLLGDPFESLARFGSAVGGGW
jgi:hypothetical protein